MTCWPNREKVLSQVPLGISLQLGACNGCDIEILNVLTPYYDVERFGIKLVASPRHADVMLVSGRGDPADPAAREEGL